MQAAIVRIGTILFVSGFCSLVYQVVWLRLLRLVFGVSTSSTAVVLAIFMGGLGLGGVLLGRRAARHPNPMALYAKLELGIALSAAASPLLIDAARWLYISLGGSSGLGLGGATVVRMVLATLILGIPTTLMGGTLPAVAQAMEREEDLGRRRVAGLYGINTLGAVVGAFLTTFVLIELVGVRQALWLSALVNVLLAMVVRSLSREPEYARELPSDAPQQVPGTSSDIVHDAPRDAPGDAPKWIVLPAAGLVGFIFFLMEIVWYRMLAPVLGGSSYTFGLILTVALFGIGFGGLLFALGRKNRRPTLTALAATCTLEAFFLALPYALGDHLALLSAILRPLSAMGFTALVLGWTLVVSIVVLPAAILAGYQFPLLVALLGSGSRKVGSEVGLAYGWNTWGAILGSLAGGFGLLPLLTAPLLWRLSTAFLVLLGIALALSARRGLARAAVPIGVGLAALLLTLAPGPSTFWRHVPIGAGRVDVHFDSSNAMRERLEQTRRSLVVEAEGVESSVALLRRNELALLVNGKSDGSALSDAPTMAMSGLLGTILHPEPTSGLVIGLGTGSTAGWMARVETMTDIDVVELEPTVIDFARHFEPIHFGVLDRPNVHHRAGDGREHVLTTKKRYDVIFSQPSNPYRAGVADLFSTDFYRAVSKRLGDGGIFLQWLQGYEVDAHVVQIAYASLADVFPNIECWQINVSDLLLVATLEPIDHDVARLTERALREPYASALRQTWRVDGIEGLYSGYVAGDGLARALARGTATSTDDRPRIEYGFARNVGRKGLFDVTDLQRLAARLGVDHPATHGGIVDWHRVRELRQVREVAESFTEPAPRNTAPDEALRRAARKAYGQGDIAAAAELWSRQPSPPLSPLDRLLIAEAHADAGSADAEAAIAQVAAELPRDAAFLDARLRWRRAQHGGADPAEAAEALARAFEALRDDPWVFRPLAQRAFGLLDEMTAADHRLGRRLLRALERPFAVMLFEEARLVTRVNLASKIDFPGECAAVFVDFEPHPVWERSFLEARVRCYELNDHSHAGRARAEFDEFLDASAPELRTE